MNERFGILTHLTFAEHAGDLVLALEVERDVLDAVAVAPGAPDGAVQPLVVVQLGLCGIPGDRAEPRRRIQLASISFES